MKDTTPSHAQGTYGDNYEIFISRVGIGFGFVITFDSFYVGICIGFLVIRIGDLKTGWTI